MSDSHSGFQAPQVLSVAWGHFTHDTFSAFVAPLLPRLIEKLSLTLTQAGALTSVLQLPAIINPFIGYLADGLSMRLLVILAPALTATLASLLGSVSSYNAALILLLAMGTSVAMFHAPAPAIIARVSGQQTGKGMGWFMAAGETGRTLGPLLAVWAIAALSLEGMWPVMLLGWTASALLAWRLRGVQTPPQKQHGLTEILPRLSSVFLPLAVLMLLRNILMVELTTYLPTFLESEGLSLWVAGGALSLLEAAGIVGALVGGPLSDRLERKWTLSAAILLAAIFTALFLQSQNWLRIPLLLGIGLTSLAPQPIFLAIIQDHFPRHRGVANGLYMSVAFLLQSAALYSVGVLGDAIGLRAAFWLGTGLSLLAIPVIWLLPNPEKPPAEAA
ncbi:MAG: MFS transporter [Anaerolineales bacterium]